VKIWRFSGVHKFSYRKSEEKNSNWSGYWLAWTSVLAVIITIDGRWRCLVSRHGEDRIAGV